MLGSSASEGASPVEIWPVVIRKVSAVVLADRFVNTCSNGWTSSEGTSRRLNV